MSDLETDGQARQPQRETTNESAETRVFDSDQILRAGMPRPGLTLRERYRLESEIGRGAMGVVFRATDLELLRRFSFQITDRLLSCMKVNADIYSVHSASFQSHVLSDLSVSLHSQKEALLHNISTTTR